MKVLIGSDKSGFALKEYLLEQLTALGYEVIDKGTPDLDHVMPFFAVAPVVAQAIQAGEGEKAILICGTGMGMSQVANKYPGILAACCESVYAARMCRAINNSNILCMAAGSSPRKWRWKWHKHSSPLSIPRDWKNGDRNF